MTVLIIIAACSISAIVGFAVCAGLGVAKRADREAGL